MAKRENYDSLTARAIKNGVKELMPWDLEELLKKPDKPFLLDVRERSEFASMHIQGSLNVPRGILESACEYDYDETEPELVTARAKEIIIICRSGNRSALAAETMNLLGYENVKSLRTGIKGWNDHEQATVDAQGKALDLDDGDEILAPKLRPDQRSPE